MKIYTKTGDNKTTQIKAGRVTKDDINVVVEGEFDEAISTIMVAQAFASADIANVLRQIAKKMFSVASDVSGYTNSISQDDVLALEEQIDFYSKSLKPLTDFILPGGKKESSFIHLARTVVRRLERSVVALSKEKEISQAVFCYLNRLSDFLFILGRYTEECTIQ